MRNGWVESMAENLPASEVQERLRETSDVGDQMKRVLAFYLYDMSDRLLFEASGHKDTSHFALEQLGMNRRRSNELIRLGRLLRHLTRIDDAFKNGELLFSSVLEITRVAEVHTQSAWLEFARGKSFAQIREEVLSCKPGDLPGEGTGYGLKPRKRQLRVEITEKTQHLLEQARELLQAEDEHLTDDQLLHHLAEQLIKQLGAGERSPEPKANAEANGDPIPPARRTEALARDNHACRNCHSHVDVEVHHLKHRSQGGTHDLYNLLTLCHACHTAVHSNRLVIKGPSSNGAAGLTFVSANGLPLARSAPGAGVQPKQGGRGDAVPS